LFTIAPREEASEHGERAAPKPDSATLAALLASAETGDTLGWRLDEQSATLASAYGLQAGDLILAVNGAGPENLAAVLSAVGSGELRVTIERDGVLQTIVVDRGDRT
jgi:type II secretory pathway component PulC